MGADCHYANDEHLVQRAENYECSGGDCFNYFHLFGPFLGVNMKVILDQVVVSDRVHVVTDAVVQMLGGESNGFVVTCRFAAPTFPAVRPLSAIAEICLPLWSFLSHLLGPFRLGGPAHNAPGRLTD